MPLLVTGTLGIDSVVTPHGEARNVLGGTAVYFALAASAYCDVRVVGVVGDDFPAEHLALLDSPRIDLRGLETRAGSKTFRWSARYLDDMNERETLETQLNVIAEAPPVVPETFVDSDVVFLANTHPALQLKMRQAVRANKLAVCDTMNLWIDIARDDLVKVLAAVDGIILNDGEARQFTGKQDLLEAGDELLELGPRFAVIKKGEHGSLLISREGCAALPAYPTRGVKDPTGAGDAFAGGMMGYLTVQPVIDDAALRRSLVHGTVAASFTIEDFSVGRIAKLTKDDLNRRVDKFLSMLRFD